MTDPAGLDLDGVAFFAGADRPRLGRVRLGRPALWRLWRASTFLGPGAVAVALAAAPAPAQADPITLTAIAATAVGGAVAGSAAVITLLGATGAALLGAAVTFGINFLGSQLFGQQSPQVQAELRVADVDPYPVFRFAIGEFPQEGTRVFQAVDGEYLYVAYLMSSTAIDGSNLELWINDVAIDLQGDITDFSATGGAYPPNSGTPWKHDVDDNPGRAQGDPEICVFWLQTGTKTQFPQDFVDYLSAALPDVATATWEGCGVLYARYRYGKAVDVQARWGAAVPPRVKLKCRWAKLYDPRLDSTSGVAGASGTHRVDDPTTWEYSANPALAYLNIAIHERGLAIPHERVVIQQFADAADDCDTVRSVATVDLSGIDETFDVAPEIVERTAAGTDPGHGKIVHWKNAYTVNTAAGTLDLISGDGAGNVSYEQVVQISVYFDVARLGLDPAKTYTIDAIDSSLGAYSGFFRQRYISADAGGGISDADQLAYGLPPDARNVVVVANTDRQDNSNLIGLGPGSFSGRYIAWTFEGGRPYGAPYPLERIHLVIRSDASAQTAQYECHGLVPVESREFEQLSGVLDSMAGHLDTSRGGVGVHAGVWRAPTVTLSEPLAETLEYAGRSDVGVDQFVGQFLSRAQDYVKTETLPYVINAGGSRKQQIPLAMVSDPEQAQQIVKIMALRAQYNRTLHGVWGSEEFARRVAENVSFTYSLLQGKADGDWIVAEERLTVEEVEQGVRVRRPLGLRETSSAIYGWDPDVDFPAGASVVVQPPGVVADLAPPTNPTVESGDAAALPSTSTATDASDYVAAVRGRWKASTSTGSHYDVQIKIGAGAWQSWEQIDADATIDIAGADWIESTVYPVTPGLVYSMRARLVSAAGVSDWASDSVTAAAPSGTVRDFSSGFSLDFS